MTARGGGRDAQAELPAACRVGQGIVGRRARLASGAVAKVTVKAVGWWGGGAVEDGENGAPVAAVVVENLRVSGERVGMRGAEG